MYQGKRVLVIGIGGGGDIIGCIPTAEFLKSIDAKPIIGGLTWKRDKHDPFAWPRPSIHFSDVEPNKTIWYVNEKTRVIGPKAPETGTQIETVLVPHVKYPIVAIDISHGVNAVSTEINEFCKSEGIEGVVGIDVGGDVLCKGDEKTIRSPICDQLMLAAITKMDNSVIGVAGIGTDGELPLKDFKKRFLQVEKGYLGAISIPDGILDMINNILSLDDIGTESSREYIRYVAGVKEAERKHYEDIMNKDSPAEFIDKIIGSHKKISLRDGKRIGELCELTTLTMFFKPDEIYRANLFSSYIEKHESVTSLREYMIGIGLKTEPS